MKFNLKNYAQLPDVNLDQSKKIIYSVWKILDPKDFDHTVGNIYKSFDKYGKNHYSNAGMLSYSCFFSLDNRFIIHFSQWKDKQSITYFEKNDPEERIPEMLSDLKVERLVKQEYTPHKTIAGTNNSIDTQIIVFVKQYFETAKDTTNWIDLIATALQIEHPINGLIRNTYYLSEDGKSLLNYALWENDKVYQQFLAHTNQKTKENWDRIINFPGWDKMKGEIIKCDRFIKLM